MNTEEKAKNFIPKDIFSQAEKDKMLDLYMNKYFCTLSEKEKWKTLKEKAESIV